MSATISGFPMQPSKKNSRHYFFNGQRQRHSFTMIFRVHITVNSRTSSLFYRLYVNCLFAPHFISIFFRRMFTGALEDGSAPMPDMFVSKYNKFVDGIFTRINTILKKSYDPVNVQLNMEGAEVKSSSVHKKSNKK